ncbi:MAG: hypothetical protein FJ040_01935 [Chloroflexi bacterium]|nr:hypothetical protein [Chloroflexota bacterium]
MINQRNILRIDGSAGLIAGVIMWLLSDVLVALYQIPAWLFTINITANLIYGISSSLIASWPHRPLGAVISLSVANLLWATVCLVTAVLLAPTASLFGIGHFVGEGLFVGTLGVLEWRWRHALQHAV